MFTKSQFRGWIRTSAFEYSDNKKEDLLLFYWQVKESLSFRDYPLRQLVWNTNIL